jgi:hypothetical protein
MWLFQVTSDGEIWRHYATLLMENPDASPTDKERVSAREFLHVGGTSWLNLS